LKYVNVIVKEAENIVLYHLGNARRKEITSLAILGFPRKDGSVVENR